MSRLSERVDSIVNESALWKSRFHCKWHTVCSVQTVDLFFPSHSWFLLCFFNRPVFSVSSTQPAQLVPEPSICIRNVPVRQNDDRGPEHRLVFTLSQKILKRPSWSFLLLLSCLSSVFHDKDLYQSLNEPLKKCFNEFIGKKQSTLNGLETLLIILFRFLYFKFVTLVLFYLFVFFFAGLSTSTSPYERAQVVAND